MIWYRTEIYTSTCYKSAIIFWLKRLFH